MTKRAELPHIYDCFLKSSAVCTDTRKLSKGCFFVALKGETFDGNKFVVQAFEAGAEFALMDDQTLSAAKFLEPYGDRIFLVEDALSSLQDLATYHREKLALPILALTGSNGKTTTKELLQTALSQKLNCLATMGNLNNHIGVPLTLLRLTKNTELGIVEMGANHQGEIALLCKIARPNYGYITNFGKAHLEGFGGVEGVIKGKSELIDYLTATSGRMFVQATDTRQMERTEKLQRTVLNADMQWHLLTEDHRDPINSEDRLSQPTLLLSGPKGTIKTQLIGAYNAPNVIAAAEIAEYFNLPWDNIKAALEQYTPHMNRSQGLTRGRYNLIMDAYNANPSSMQAALDYFGQLTSHDHKVVILGDMFELGQAAAAEHQIIVNLAEQLGFDQIYLAGDNFSKTKHNPKQTLCFDHYNALEQHLLDQPPKPGTILIKGSRGMALERLLSVVFRE